MKGSCVLVVLAGLALAGFDSSLAGGEKETEAATTARGRLRAVRPAGRVVVVRTDAGRTVELAVGPGARLLWDGRDVALKDLKVGSEVIVTYRREGKGNRLVRLCGNLSKPATVKRRIRATMEAARWYGFAEKADYERELGFLQRELDGQADYLRVRLDYASGETREALLRQMWEARTQQAALRRWQERVRAATPKTWPDVKKGLAAVLPEDRAVDEPGTTTITGRIEAVRPASGVVVLSSDGRIQDLAVTFASRLFVGGRPAQLRDLGIGARAVAVYTPEKGAYILVRLSASPATSADAYWDVRAALEAIRSSSYKQKGDYEKRLRGRLAELDRHIEDLRVRVGYARGAVRDELVRDLYRVRLKHRAVRDWLDRVKSATPKTWGVLQKDVSKTLEEVGKAFERVRGK
jgi:hypothetical protein